MVAVAAGKTFSPADVPKRFWVLAVFCSVIPDADVLGFAFGIPYHHFFGHRGFFHSPFFALLLSTFVVSLFFPSTKSFSKLWWYYVSFFFLVSASHGVLDALTDGGLGIALLSPFDNNRYFFPWTPISVSPIGIMGLMSYRGFLVIKSEFIYVWLPSLVLATFISSIRKRIAE